MNLNDSLVLPSAEEITRNLSALEGVPKWLIEGLNAPLAEHATEQMAFGAVPAFVCEVIRYSDFSTSQKIEASGYVLAICGVLVQSPEIADYLAEVFEGRIRIIV